MDATTFANLYDTISKIEQAKIYASDTKDAALAYGDANLVVAVENAMGHLSIALESLEKLLGGG